MGEEGAPTRLFSSSYVAVYTDAMDHSVTALERAFQLAKSGKCTSLADLKKRLHAEGYSIAQITGRTLAKQLVVIIKMARPHMLKT
jgi:hypothetical protein